MTQYSDGRGRTFDRHVAAPRFRHEHGGPPAIRGRLWNAPDPGEAAPKTLIDPC